MARQIHIITVGKLKNKNLESLEDDYSKRINNPDILVHEVKATAENKDAEGEAILKKSKEILQNGPGLMIALTEWGKTYTSIEFADWMTNIIEQHSKIIFIIAGAEGFSKEILSNCQAQLSLSKLTFPHKIARIILIEQIYRAQTIRTGHPYHN